MQLRHISMVIAILTLSLFAEGAVSPVDSVRENSWGTFRVGSRYVLSRMTLLGKEEPNQTEAQNNSLTLDRGTEFEVIENFKGSDGRELVRIGLDVEEDYMSDLPSDLWVDARDLNLGQPQMMNAQEGLFQDVSSYDEYEVAGPAQKRRGRRTGGSRGGMTYCYRNVKKRLMSQCGVDVYLPGAAAYQAETILPQYGFKKISADWSNYKDLPVCTVCVSSGGSKNCGTKDRFQACGDVAMKVSKAARGGWHGWKPRMDSPILGNHTSLGCFYKEP
ncbi:hypothetical protein [Bdellovibrio sp. HCB-162]|uniref:hypothetical protein n=1 Tax=Bdellovibrio sp. HCB-162 TaxID=3394234 RepID=UPI0039BCDD04